MKYRYDLYDFGCIPASATYPAAPTDNTVAIQNALNNVPAGGTLEIPPDYLFSPTGQFVGGFGFGQTLTRNLPINIVGGGYCSNLKPLPSFSTTADNLVFQQGGTYWFNSTLYNFAIGDDAVAVPYSRKGGKAIFFNATGGMANTFIEKVRVGESGNDHSIVINGLGTQHCRLKEGVVWGGYKAAGVADNHIIADTDFLGHSPFGVLIDMPGAYGAKMTDCVITAVGAVVVQSGSSNQFESCTFEEMPGHPTNNSWLTGVNGQIVLCGCPNAAVQDTRISNCDFTMFASTSNANCIVTNQGNMGIARTHLSHSTLAIGNGLAAVYNSGDAGFVSGPNTWIAATRFKAGGIAPVQLIGGG